MLVVCLTMNHSRSQSPTSMPILPSYENEKHEDDESLLGIVTRKAIAPLRGKSKTS